MLGRATRPTMIRPDEHLILFPTLARPVGDRRWDAHLHGVLFKPELGSLKRKLFIRAIARAAGVRHDKIVGPRLAERLHAFLADNKRRRTIRVRIGDDICEMGPSAPSGHLSGRLVLKHPAPGAIDYATTDEECDDRTFAGRLHLLPATGISVICDIDDTIKHSNVPDTRDLLRNTFLRPDRAIDPVIAHCGTLAAAGASFHYVSASPWQLYPTLSAFIREQSAPDGTFHLKRFRLKDTSALAILSPPERFKRTTIEPLLRGWPRRSFIFIGDSAERDPEIYGDLARRFPRQLAGLIIRDITPDPIDSPRYRKAFDGVPRDRVHLIRDAGDWTGAASAALDRASSRVR